MTFELFDRTKQRGMRSTRRLVGVQVSIGAAGTVSLTREAHDVMRQPEYVRVLLDHQERRVRLEAGDPETGYKLTRSMHLHVAHLATPLRAVGWPLGAGRLWRTVPTVADHGLEFEVPA